MSFLCKQVSADRWGIYSGTRLLATVSDRATCEAIMSNFENGRNKVPTEVSSDCQSADKANTAQALSNITIEAGDITATPAAEAISEQTAATVELSTEHRQEQSAVAISDDDLAKLIAGKSLKVKELESVVLRAQMRQNR